jgi:hypothetical protein
MRIGRIIRSCAIALSSAVPIAAWAAATPAPFAPPNEAEVLGAVDAATARAVLSDLLENADPSRVRSMRQHEAKALT